MLISISAFAESAGTVYYAGNNKSIKASDALTNETGSVVAYQDNLYIVNNAGNITFPAGVVINGYSLGAQNCVARMYGDLTVGEGGITLAYNGTSRLNFYRNSNDSLPANGVKVAASQTWKVDDSVSTTANLPFFTDNGSPDYGIKSNTEIPLTVASGVNLTVDNIKLYLLSDKSSAAGATVTLQNKSQYYPLVEGDLNATLGADKFVIRDSAALNFGAELHDLWSYGSSARMYSHRLCDSAHIAKEIALAGNGTINGNGALAVAVEKLSATGTGNTISVTEIDFPNEITIDVAEDAELTIANTGSYPKNLKNVTLTGSGTLKINKLDGVTVMFGDVSSFSGTIDVYGSGTGTIVLPVDKKNVITVQNEGSSTTTVIYDDSDNVITDTAWASSELHIVSNETYYVVGNGLTAATKVYLDGGSLVVIKNGATIGADIEVTASSNLKTMPVGEVEATFAGSFSAADDDTLGLTLSLDGNFVLTKGGSFPGNKESVNLDSGTVKITGAGTKLSLAGTSGIRSTSTATYWGVLDGAEMETPYKANNWNSFYVSGGASPVLEIGENAKVTIGDSRELHCSRNAGGSTNVCTVLVNGGTLRFDSNGLATFGEYSVEKGGKSVLDFRSGLIETKRPLGPAPYATKTDGVYGDWNAEAPRFEFKWTGGTFKVDDNTLMSRGTLLQPKDYYQTAQSQVTSDSRTVKYWATPLTNYNMHMSIEGPDCVLDLSDLPSYAVLTNMPARSQGAWVGMIDGYEVHDVGGMDWNGTADGCLTVTGGTFAVNFFNANGMKVKLQEAKLVVPAVTNDLDFGEIILDSANAQVVADSVEDGKSVTASFRVTANGVWNGAEKPIDIAGVSIANATFEAGAGWILSPALAISGTLTLPDGGAIDYTVPGGTASPLAFATFGELVGAPEWRKVGGVTRRIRAAADSKSLYCECCGLTIVIR